jgi:tetratricopeptide (TPR) repeat protein
LRSCSIGSHDQIYQGEAIRHWLQNEDGILDVIGDSGFGKTILAAGVIEKISKDLGPSSFLGYAFCLRHSPVVIFQSLIWQMVSSRKMTTNHKSRIIESLHENWISANARTTREVQDLFVLRELYRDLLLEFSQITLVIDGIDQSESPDLLTQHICNIAGTLSSSSTSVKLLFTGQHVYYCHQRLSENLKRHNLTITEEDVRYGAEKFLDQSLPALDPPLGDTIQARIRLTCLQVSNTDWISILYMLAYEYMTIGRYKQTENLALEVLAFREERFAENSKFTLGCKRILAIAMMETERPKEAEVLLRAALQLSKENPLIEEQFSRNLMNDLSSALREQERLPEAKELQLQLVDMLRERGEDKVSMISMMNNLSVTYAMLGQLDEAEDILREALANAGEMWGEDEEKVVDYKANLGQILAKKHKWAEAEELETSAMESRIRNLGVNDTKTLASISKVAWAHQQQGRFQEAKELYLKALDGRTRILGPTHPETLSIIGDLAVTVNGLGEHAEARRYARRYAGISLGWDV